VKFDRYGNYTGIRLHTLSRYICKKLFPYMALWFSPINVSGLLACGGENDANIFLSSPTLVF
jgi:hypothetical protein